MGSGYSTLHALFLACGSIPFGREEESNGELRYVKCVHVTDEVLQAIQDGRNICDWDDPNIDQVEGIEYLSRLPCSRGDFYYGCDQKAEKDQLGLIRDINRHPLDELHATWWAAVAGIAFGGLVPQATQNVRDAVLFTVAGIRGFYLEKRSEDVKRLHSCISELEQPIYELHQEYSKRNDKLNLFGDFVEKALVPRSTTELVTWETPCINTRDAAAIFGRYMTLLEHMVAIFEIKPGIPGYENGVFNTPKGRMEAVYRAACTLLQDTYKQALNPHGIDLEEDLVKKLKYIKNRVKNHDHITLDDCAIAVKCILAAWAEKVMIIHPRLGEESLVLEGHKGCTDIDQSLTRIQQEIFATSSESSPFLVAKTAQSIEQSSEHQTSHGSNLPPQKEAAENGSVILWYLPGILAFA
jgi:hypothetical protein